MADAAAEDETLRLTYVALAISLAAFGLAALQAVLAYLQFDNSEGGRRRCSPEVMGKEWASKTESKYRWRELRYQVFFEVPVFYTAPPGITVGPLTLTKPETTVREWARRALGASDAEPEPVATFEPAAVPLEVIKLQPHVAPIYKITGSQTSYRNTMVSYTNRRDEKWANVHTAEDEGCSWILLLDALQAQERISRLWDRGPANQGLDHTICYLIQRKRRCWDFMPLNATKPFATTTICHLVEIMSMLGMVWTDFDVKASLLSAEGNGYMVKSEYMSGLGILTRFSRLTKPLHEANRIIPCAEVKALCFGEVPSLFDAMGQRLQVGPGKLDACLEDLLPALPPHHRELFQPPSTNVKLPLLTPTFELIGMVAKSCHIPGSRFRRLPNPSADPPPQALRFAECLRHFALLIRRSAGLGTDPLTLELQNAFEHGRFDGLATLDPLPGGGRTLEQLTDNFITAKANVERAGRIFIPSNERDSVRKTAEDDYNNALLHLMDALHSASDRVGQRLSHEDVREHVRAVITSHFDGLFKHRTDLQKTLAGSDAVERDLVVFYFEKIRPGVLQQQDGGHGAAGSAVSTASTVASVGDTAVSGVARPAGAPLTEDDARRSAVWLALVFRTFAWLFLHEFNPKDRMIERTEYMNSRLPVYIG